MKPMNYAETEAFLFSQLPAFQKVGKSALKPGLQNIIALLEILGNPHKDISFIHIGGTNGKGSSSHMMAAILQTEGYKTGLYTSPHLKSFRERIKINGEMITEEEVVYFVEHRWEQFKEIKPSFFEITVALAFYYFKKSNVDIAVIEVGLGGRLDSTNVIDPIASLITNIGFDHTDILGKTIAAIASEKAGIIKNKRPIIVSEFDSESSEVFIQKAMEQNAPLFFAKDFFQIDAISKGDLTTKYLVKDRLDSRIIELTLDLKGNYQAKNILGVLTLCKVLNSNSTYTVKTNNIYKGLSSVIALTSLKGRWQTLSLSPLTICDTGHNTHAFKILTEYIEEIKAPKTHLILGFSKDKDVETILPLLPKEGFYYLCSFESFRSADEGLLKAKFLKASLNIVNTFNNVNTAIDEVKKMANENDFIFIGGSTYMIAEINEL